MNLKSIWRKRWSYLPIIHLFIEIPLVSIRTGLMVKSFKNMTKNYIVLQCRVWKWRFEFELYDTERRFHNRTEG